MSNSDLNSLHTRTHTHTHTHTHTNAHTHTHAHTRTHTHTHTHTRTHAELFNGKCSHTHSELCVRYGERVEAFIGSGVQGDALSVPVAVSAPAPLGQRRPGQHRCARQPLCEPHATGQDASSSQLQITGPSFTLLSTKSPDTAQTSLNFV